MRSVALTALLLTTAVVFPVRAEETGRADQDLFTSQVRPILARHCFKCHGPDDKARKAKLRLDVRERGGETGRFGSHCHRPGQTRRERAGQPDLRRRRERADAARRDQEPALRAQTSRFSSSGSPTEPNTRPTGHSSRRDQGHPPQVRQANWARNADRCRSSWPASRRPGCSPRSRRTARP